MSHRRDQSRLDGVMSAAVLLSVPGILLGVFGPPWAPTRSVPLALHLALWSAWAAWVWAISGLIRNVIRRVRTRDLELGARSRGLERLAVRVATGILWLASCVLPAGTAMSLPATSPMRPSASNVLVASSTHRSVVVPSTPATPSTYIVVRGDCLWTIAERQLGDPQRWPELARLNLGRTMPDGRIFTDPSLILPGWTLLLAPQAATLIVPHQPTAPTAQTAPIGRLPSATPAARDLAIRAASSSGLSALVIPASLGLGAVLMGLALRRRRRRGRPSSRETLIDLDLALARTEPLVATALVERAIILADQDGVLTAPCVLELDELGARLLRTGVQCWQAMPRDLDHPIEVDRAPGLVLVLGDLDARTYALIVPPGTEAAIAGAGAANSIESSLLVQEEFCWGPLLGDADLNGTRAELDLSGTNDLNGLAVVHVVDEADVVMSDGAFSIDSLGISSAAATLSDDLIELLEGFDDTGAPAPLTISGATEPAVLIRMLCSLPKLEGLADELEPKRARRATELLAYLALNRPGPITGDRLRTRVLGSPDADAAAKTLFNVASAARHALGHDARGSARLPSANRLGHYELSEDVGTDIELFARYLAAAAGSDDDDVGIAHLRSALDLIESEPMAAALSGWEWFGAEGHRARLDAAVEHAALDLAARCLRRGLFDLAHHGLNQARLVVPYSEALAEQAMELAAAQGNLLRLRSAYGDLGQIVETLDPGCWPVASIEQRYRALLETAQANFAAIEAAPRSTRPSAPAAL